MPAAQQEDLYMTSTRPVMTIGRKICRCIVGVSPAETGALIRTYSGLYVPDRQTQQIDEI